MQYKTWKEECRKLFPLVGAGKFITAPIITDKGKLIHNPYVLLQTKSGINGVVIPPLDSDASNLEWVTDNRVIQWMSTLHQIGSFSLIPCLQYISQGLCINMANIILSSFDFE